MLKKAGTVAFVLLSLLYPCLVYFGLQRWSYKVFGVMIIAVGAGKFLLSRLTGSKGDGPILMISVICGIAIWTFPSDLVVKAYPVMVSGFMGTLFLASLLQKESLIERIARLRGADMTPAAIHYTRRLTIAWAILLYANGAVALYLAHFGTTQAWTLYCGFLSYLILGAFMGGELLFRRYYMQKQDVYTRQQRLREGNNN